MRAVEAVTDRVRDISEAVSRAAPVPLAVRCGVFLSGLVAVVLAYPAWLLFTRPGTLLLIAPLLPALLPRGRWPTVLALVAVGGWAVGTAAVDGPVNLAALLGLAAALYLLHSLSALAAALPYDAMVRLDVVVSWLGRTGAVLLASSTLSAGALLLADRTSSTAAQAAALAGVAVAVLLSGVLAWLWRRR